MSLKHKSQKDENTKQLGVKNKPKKTDYKTLNK